jgi:DNA-binding response OmpR family regulator
MAAPGIPEKQITNLPHTAKILVVAPDPAFRRSLAFAIEAEGFEVDLADRLPAAEKLSGRYDCLVVDHRAIPAGTAAPSGMPLILLASHVEDVSAFGMTQVLEKPLLGHTLIEALRTALERDPL